MELSDIIKDAKNYPDTLEVAVGDGVTVPLGALRERLHAAETHDAELAQQRKQLEQGMAELQRGREILAEQVQALQAAAGASAGNGNGQRVAEQLWKWEAPDPYIEPVVGRINEYQSRLDQLAQALGRVTAVAEAAIRGYGNRLLRLEYDGLPDRPKDLALDRLLAEARDARAFDEYGIPKLREHYEQNYLNKLRQERDLESRIAAEREKWEREAREAQSRRPAAPFFAPNAGMRNAAEPQKEYRDLSEFFGDIRSNPAVLDAYQRDMGGGS